MRHFLDVDDLSPDELRSVLDASSRPAAGAPAALEGQGVALVFEKASNRTRNSMEMAVRQLGGHPVYIRPEEVGMDVRESAEDIVRTLACYHAIVARSRLPAQPSGADGGMRGGAGRQPAVR